MKQLFGIRLICIAFVICCHAHLSSASAQTPGTVVDTPTITRGGAPLYPQGFSNGTNYGTFGSISPTKTADGYQYIGFFDIYREGKIGACTGTQLKIGGFASDPGQSWLISAGVNGVSFEGTSGNYSYSNGQATWTFSCGPAFINKPSPAQATIVHGGDTAYLDMKWQVLAVDYAPPGQQSTVSYGTSAMRGTATSNASTFNSTTTLTVTGDLGVNFFGIVEGGLTGSTSTQYAQQSGSNSMISIQTTASNSDIVKGPSSSSVGIDHDADVIWLWVNPLAIEYLGANNTIAWGGYAWNAADNASVMEVIPIYVGWLKNPSTMDPSVATRLARSWDQTGLGALTSADYAQILRADPFANSTTYNPSTDSGHRFDLVSGSTIPYVPATPGFQPVTWTGSISTVQTSSQGQTASQSYQVGFTLDWSSKIDWIAEIASDVKLTSTYQWTDSWSSTINSQTGKTASYSITGPASTDHYTGPVSFQVWRDNIYGSFMFYPVQ